MIFPNLSKLSQIIAQENKSFSYQIISPHHLKQQIRLLKNDMKSINLIFQQFRDHTYSFMKQWMGKICTLTYKLVKEKIYFQNQFQKSQKIQNNMKNQVIQLKEMIQQAMHDYQIELDSKNKQIKNLLQQLQMMKTISSVHNVSNKQQQQIKIQQQRRTERQSQLQIIQEQSSHVTYSEVGSLRDSKESKFQQKSIQDISQSHIISIANDEQINKSKKQQRYNNQNDKQYKCENKTIKTFIDHFRKTIQQSLSQNQQNITQNFSNKNNTRKQPLKEITFGNPQISINNKYYTQGCKDSQIQDSSKNSQIFSINQQYNHGLSSCSSQSDYIINADSEKINIPKKFQVATNKMFARKKEHDIQSRIKTQPSPQAKQSPCSNVFYSTKGYNSHKKIFLDKKAAERSHSNDDKSCKSNKSSFSKQKIKITSKMIDEVSYGPKKANNATKAFVYLGGKSIFRKFLSDLKLSFKKYVINMFLIENQIYYEGEKKSGLRSGKGLLFYKNGIIYEGMFRQNMKHGKGSITLNGISIYEGEWCNDKLQGEGYIKSMKCMSDSCSPIFNQSSYLGNFYDNKLHGVGTIFLNPKQKIVTKFIHGIPVGDLTYYNLHEIQFGVWPTQ